MFQSDYRREMDSLAPGSAAMERLEELLAEGPAEGKRPRRRLGRRAALALALCGALTATALAAGPSIRQALSAHLGSFAPYGQALEGTATVNGVEIRLLEAVTDGYSARVYYTLTDLEGGRFNDHTAVGGSISAENLGAVARFGGGVISYDPDTGTLLVEKLLFGADFSQPAALTVGSADSSRRTFDAVLPVTLPEKPIQTTLVDGRAVALPGQNTVTDPDNGDYVLSTVGFDGEGRFHALVLFD